MRTLERARSEVPRGVRCSRSRSAARSTCPIHYTGFEIPNRFAIGYGLDYVERFRNLPYVAVLAIRASVESVRFDGPLKPVERRFEPAEMAYYPCYLGCRGLTLEPSGSNRHREP